jgi:hypothetical protein
MTLLIILEQPLDVIEFDLRTLRVGEAPAEFFENPAHPLHVDFAGNLHGHIVAKIPPVQGTAQRIALVAAALLAAGAIAGTIALTIAVALLHGLGETLCSLAQSIERLALRIDGAVGIALAELAAGIAHRVVSRAKTILVIALLRFAILALLALLTALAGRHAALG